MQLLIGTNNKGKVIEISEVLAESEIEIITPASLGIEAAPVEDGKSYEENALIKARFFHTAANGVPTVADDSGIVVDALQGELGMHTRRWGAGAAATDEEWIAFFLDRMKYEMNKRAAFVCYLAYIDASGTETVFAGRCSGTITRQLEADYLPGLPISACFRPDGYDKVFSALSTSEKNKVSHRGKATQAFVDHLTATL